MNRFIAFSLLVAVAVGACDCEGAGTRGADSLPVVDKLVVDFGRVRLGETARDALTVANHGAVQLELAGFDRSALPDVFRAAELPKTLSAGATHSVALVFAPTEPGVVRGTLLILADDEDVPPLEVELRGEGVETLVDIAPETVDFGVVEVDSRVSRSIVLRNDGDIVEEVSVLTLANGSEHFSGGPVPGGDNVVRLEPGASAEIPVSFAPRWADPAGFISTVTFLPCASCSTVTVTLVGVGVDSFLTLVPKPPACLNFGLVNPGASVTKVMTARNLGASSMTLLSGEVTDGDAVFSTPSSFPVDIGSEDDVEIAITYGPRGIGPDTGTFILTSTDPKAARVAVCLEGSGGGPDVLVQPLALDFGQVATGSSRTKTVRVANVGQGGGAAATPLRVEQARIRSGDAHGYSVDFQPFVLDAGQARTVNVHFAPTADGRVNDVLEFVTNDTDTPVAEVALSGRGRELAPCELALVPASGELAFGNVERGRTALLPLGLRNVGADDCLVDSLRMSPSSHQAFSLPQPPPEQFEIRPGQTFAVPVQFLPLVHAGYVGEITFGVSNPATPVRRVPLSGLSAVGCLLVSPSEIDFGVTQAECVTGERTVNVYNVCGTPVSVEGVALADDPSGSYRLTVPGSATFPLEMTGATTLAFQVRYQPAALGEHPGGVFVKSSERPEPYLVSLTGAARENAVQTDVFDQSRRPIDILFVIDDSGSMAPYQQGLATNLESFMLFANRNFVDYQIGVVTTDVDNPAQAGRLVPLVQTGAWPASNASPPRVLKPTTPEVLRAFKQSVNVGTNGSGTEKGLEAAYQALNPQMLSSHNQGFLRDEAMLSIIVVTDEADQSPSDPNFYYGYFLNIKGARRANLLSISAICEMDPNATVNYGGRYLDLVQRTGGVASSIHTANWAADLERLGLAAFGYKSRFTLTATPDVPSIEVRLDGRALPAEDEESRNWWFDPVANLVEFNPHAIPEPGQQIEISYAVVCGEDS